MRDMTDCLSVSMNNAVTEALTRNREMIGAALEENKKSMKDNTKVMVEALERALVENRTEMERVLAENRTEVERALAENRTEMKQAWSENKTEFTSLKSALQELTRAIGDLKKSGDTN